MKKVKNLITKALHGTPVLLALGAVIIGFAENATTRCLYPAWIGAPEMPKVLRDKIN